MGWSQLHSVPARRECSPGRWLEGTAGSTCTRRSRVARAPAPQRAASPDDIAKPPAMRTRAQAGGCGLRQAQPRATLISLQRDLAGHLGDSNRFGHIAHRPRIGVAVAPSQARNRPRPLAAPNRQ
ncbi:hypothetical protein XAP7430_440046 [Xanthomonas phaseoli pv. phaseoli]|uniref:Uncharacterized protein n=1 Tax=Xanthomonas campestris pv. phaseoli TaxID=317013 RepID=A0AB38E1Z7_XANCH|nr:hypothetical protein XAP6984_470046 [Xanthomonas phaseoli pv. phaseoli]SON90104.1 hypothetical protein XAP7430_440046 [Xanthomonas phaseoli pv. phaseoli]